MTLRRKLVGVDDESGFTTAWILCLVLIVFMVGFTFYDIGQALVQRQKLVTAADRAANAGATAIDETYLINNGVIRLQKDTITEDGVTTLSAEDRCLEAFISEKSGQAKSVLKTVDCDVEGGVEGQVIAATAKGMVSFGTIAGLLNVEPKEFSVTSRSKPTCSNELPADGEDC